jgi:hypothetical protein
LTLSRRVSASALLVAGMLGVPSVAYPLSHGQYAVAALVGVTAITALIAFRRFTRTLPYSGTAATIAALVALVATVDALGRTDIGKTGAPRTVFEQAGLIFLTCIAGAAAAFAASFVRLARLRPKPQGPDRPKSDA